VGAIPGQQEVHSVNGRSSDVKGVHESLAWERPIVHEPGSQVPDFTGDGQYRDARERRQPTFGSQRISVARFSEDRLGNVEVVSSSGCPPCVRDLLVRGYDNVSTWERRQVTDDARLDIDLG
jgi:hypothetical protein